MKFAKLFEFVEDQVLITQMYDDNDDVFKIHQATVLDGVYFEISACFKNETDSDDYFSSYDVHRAETFLDHAKSLAT